MKLNSNTHGLPCFFIKKTASELTIKIVITLIIKPLRTKSKWFFNFTQTLVGNMKRDRPSQDRQAQKAVMISSPHLVI